MVMTFNRTVEWDDLGWRDRAACRDSDPALFFPVAAAAAAPDDIAAAKAVCHSCPVQAECLRFALQTRQEAGVWGGTSEDERRRLRRRLSRRSLAASRPAATGE